MGRRSNIGVATAAASTEFSLRKTCYKMFQSRRLSFGGFRTATPTDHVYATESRLYGTGASSARGATTAAAVPPPVHHRSISAMPNEQRGSSSTKAPYGYATFAASSIPFSSTGSSTYASRGVSPSASQKSISSATNVYSRSTAALYEMNGGGAYYQASVPGVSSLGALDANNASSSLSTSHLPTPSSTPTTQRKNRRISNIFQRPSKGHESHATSAASGSGSSSHHNHSHHEDGGAKSIRDVGQGRAIPIMQGQLYKRSGGKSALNRGEWKKKFVTLTNDGKLTYHQSLKEYMDNGQGKEVFLGLAAVRLPGRQRPRNSQAASTLLEGTATAVIPAAADATVGTEQHRARDGTSAHGPVATGEGTSGGGSDDGTATTAAIGISTAVTIAQSRVSSTHVPVTPQTVANSKKRRGYSRKIGGGKGGADEEEECFEIVTCDQKRWEFCAASAEEREEWVRAIEGQIDAALQKQTSAPSNQQRVLGARTEVAAIVSMPGNEICADCKAARPEWASLNLGTVICMECSGVHRNLGSHISKVRSLKFDEWPVEYLGVMRGLGNTTANRLWEARRSSSASSSLRVDASPEERETFIRAKYAEKRWMAPLADCTAPIAAQLIGAVLAGDVPAVAALLARATPADVNATVSATDRRTVLHLACSTGRVVVVQLLLWNNADVRALDERGQSALWHARNGDAAECAAVLLAAGLPADYGVDKQKDKDAATTTQQQQQLHESQMVLGSLSSRDYSDSTRRLTSVGNA